MSNGTGGPASSGFAPRLTLVDAALIVVGATVGIGIFFTPASAANVLPDGGLLLLAWTVAGLLSFAGALTYAELGALRSEAGGPYLYLRAAFGRGPSLLYGVGALGIVVSGAVALMATVFALNLARFVPYGEGAVPFVAAAAVALLTATNVLGVKPGARFNNALTGVKIATLLFLGISGLLLGRASSGAPAEAHAPPSGGGFLAALVPILFSYGGWQAVTSIAPEVRNPRRTLPLALALGSAIVVLLYLLANAGYLAVLGAREMARLETTFAVEVASRTMGGLASDAVAAAILVSALGVANAYVLVMPRIAYAMAEDGLFPRAVASLHPRFRTPHVALLGFGAWTIAVLFLSPDFDRLLGRVVAADWFFFAACGAALLKLRARLGPPAPGTFRTPLHPLVPVVFVLGAASVAVVAAVQNPLDSLAGAGLLAGAALVIAILSRRSYGSSGP